MSPRRPARKNGLTIYNSAGKIVVQLAFRKECSPEIWLKKGYKYQVKDDEEESA